MGTPALNDLDGLLASLNQLKPPGASKNKIQQITALSVTNIQAESSIVQSFYRALKKAPATHKLGALYVIDSVVRQWIDKAKASGQELQFEGRGEPGTYSAAVKRVTELMPSLFEDIMKGLPVDQRIKLENMIAIWERGNTFPVKLLNDFKSKLSGASNPAAPTNGAPANPPASAQKTSGEKMVAPKPSRPLFTPIGYPPRHVYDQGFLPGRRPPTETNGAHAASQQQQQQQQQQAPVLSSYDPRSQALAHQQPQQSQPQAAPPADVNSILAALSRAAPAVSTPTYQPVAQPPPPQQAPPPPQQGQLPPNLAALFAQQPQHVLPQYPQPNAYAYSTPPSAPPAQYAYQPPAQYPGYPPQAPPSIPQAYPVAPPPPQPQPSSDPLAQLRQILPENILNDQQKLVPALQLLQDLQKDGITMDKWGPVLKAFEEQFQPTQPAQPAPPTFAAQGDYGRGRGRSRSPDRNAGGRGSPVYGSYDAEAAKRQLDGSRDPRGARGRYRQRSPVRNSPGAGAANGRPMQPKMIGFDPSLPPDNIKVLSRTLFVGGANGTQQEIQQIFERFGQVQTCIANRDKRHAFVKMTTRDFALNAKQGMEELQSRNDREVMSVARQTKWGVGFGPRECCDYQRGESIIPIHKLTEADMKWLLTAEFGGTGGKPLEGGMVLEEPDIEIGAGVSSKAMSKRVGPDNNPGKRQKDDRGRHGRKGGDRDRDNQQSYAYNQGPPPMDYGSYARPEPVAVATPPAVPGFGFTLGQPPYR